VRQSACQGARLGLPFGIATFVLAISFGIVATGAGISELATIAMSAIVFAGSGQFAALAIVTQGGTVAAAVAAAALVNSRYVPMGVALAGSLPGRALARAAQGQAITDPSFVLSARGDGTFDRGVYFGCTAVQYVGWVVGTAVGAFYGRHLGDPRAIGLDAIFPMFFLALLIGEVQAGRGRGVAAAGALIALALVPVAPAGVPVLAASLAALIGLRRRLPAPGGAA
jgi:predicted branched-subunit amino acid permease